MIKIHCSEEGSVLLSTFHLLLFISFLIMSLTSVVRHQVMQLQQISHSYEAKALIEVSEALLRDRSDVTGIESATLYFNQGHVDIRKETETLYTFVAKLPNHYTSQLTISIVQAADNENTEPKDSENTEVQDDDNTESQEVENIESLDSENTETLETDKERQTDLESEEAEVGKDPHVIAE